MKLPFSTCLHDDESAASFASRLAWVNGIPSIVDLFTDARLSIADFLKGDPSTLMELAALGDVPVQRLTHRAFILKGKSSFEIAGNEIGQHNLLRGNHRICPACFRADTGGHIAEQTLPNAYGRILWSLASARVCPIHHLRLIAPPEDAITHEFLQSWVPWLPEILARELDEPVLEGGAFEAHVVLRLSGARTTGWVSEFPIDALGAACEMLGVSRSFGKEMTLGALTQTQLATATSVGFTLLDQGADALSTYFETLRCQSGTPQDRPQSRYGRIYDWLKRGAGSGPAFAPIRELLRDHILQTWPLGPGEQALDFRVVERRLHSIRSAAKTYGLHPKRLRRILMDAAVISETDAPDAEVIFRVSDVGNILEQASAAVSLASAQKRLAMTRSQMETLIRAGLLKPGEGGNAARPRFTEASIQHWSDFFASFPPAGLYHSLTSIADAARSLGTSTDIILKLVIDKRLGTVQRANGLNGFACLLINQAEAAKLLTATRGVGTSQSLSSLASAIRISPKVLRTLAEAGYFRLIECIDARTNQPVTRVSDEDVTLFSTDYISLRKFVGSSQRSQFVKRDLLAREIWPVFTCPEQKEFLYRRGDIE